MIVDYGDENVRLIMRDLIGDDLIDVGCVAVTIAVAIAVATNERNAFRAVVGVVFALYVPGRAIVSNWPRMAARSQLAAPVLFSLSILTLLATLTLWAGQWHPLGLLEVECVVVGITLFAALWRRRRADRLAGTASTGTASTVTAPALMDDVTELFDLDR